jgi:hypothetical protein
MCTCAHARKKNLLQIDALVSTEKVDRTCINSLRWNSHGPKPNLNQLCVKKKNLPASPTILQTIGCQSVGEVLSHQSARRHGQTSWAGEGKLFECWSKKCWELWCIGCEGGEELRRAGMSMAPSSVTVL